ncbi:MAG: hypothetical protein JW942_01115 [Opitutales bacterium]|nr:hypothetical protein [Opitutales bacterium]
MQTPNREFFRFVEKAAVAGCKPAAQEYRHDRFCSLNPDKQALLRLTLVTGTSPIVEWGKRAQPLKKRLTEGKGASN